METVIHPNLAFAQLIAVHLNFLCGGGWSAVPFDAAVEMSRVSLKSSKSPEFFLKFGGYGNEHRLEISYHRVRSSTGEYFEIWAKDGSGKIDDPKISVALSKSAEQIAKDVSRRLLPDTMALHVLVKERIAQNDEYLNKKDSLAKRVVEASGATKSRTHASSGIQTVDIYECLKPTSDSVRYGYGDVSISSDSVDIKMNGVPADLGIEIVTAIKNILLKRKNA